MTWCKECERCCQTYFKLQKWLYTIAESQQEVQLAGVTVTHRGAAMAHSGGRFLCAGETAVGVRGVDIAFIDQVQREIKVMLVTHHRSVYILAGTRPCTKGSTG